MRKFREVIQPASASPRRTRPIRAERRVGLIRAIARGRQWLDEIVSGRLTIEQIAVRQKRSVRQINLTLSMAFLAPPLVKAAIEGRLPVASASRNYAMHRPSGRNSISSLDCPRFSYVRRNGGCATSLSLLVFVSSHESFLMGTLRGIGSIPFQIGVLKLLSAHPDGRATVDAIKHNLQTASSRECSAPLRRLATLAPKIDTFSAGLILPSPNLGRSPQQAGPFRRGCNPAKRSRRRKPPHANTRLASS